jgi:AraC-like DNA-binding protein
MTRSAALKPVRFDDSLGRSPTPQRPVRSRSRSLAMDTHIEPHQHPWTQFTYCASGLMQVTVTQDAVQTTYIVPPSRAVWIPAGVQHTVVVLETAELRTVDLSPTVTPAGWKDCRVLVVSKLLRELVHALDASEPGARDDAIMALTVDELHRADTQALGGPMPRDKRLRALCEAVLSNPGRLATLSEWAVDIGASERTVSRLFRTELATNYQQWRQQAILAHALPLLARGVPAREVATASGYATDSAFCAMFKLAMGKSPSHFQGKISVNR